MAEPAPRAVSYRQSEILAMLRESGRVGVEELAEHFGVTLQTIRRDLNELSEARALVRVHGGAMIASGVANLAYEARQQVAHQSKRLIGEATARLVPDNASLLINIGTTTEEVAKALGTRSGLLVITNNLHVANELYRNKSVQVIITGGSIRQGDGGIVGAVTVSQIEQFRVDMAIIGTSAIDQDGTLLDFDVNEVQISRAIIEQARKIVLVADRSKFSRTAPVKIAEMSEIDVFVTDRLPSEEAADMCRRSGVEVIEAGDVSIRRTARPAARASRDRPIFDFFGCVVQIVRCSFVCESAGVPPPRPNTGGTAECAQSRRASLGPPMTSR